MTPVGAVTVMLVSLQPVTFAGVPLKVTLLVPCVAPKSVPVMVTVLPATPAVGVMLMMLSTVIVKGDPLLGTPETVTTTFPVAAPLGTGTVMLVSLQLVGVPVVPPPNVMVLVP